MNSIKNLLLLCSLGVTQVLFACSYETIETAVQASDCGLVKQLLRSAALKQEDVLSLINVADAIIAKRKLAMEQRQATINYAILLKLVGPFTALGGFAIGGYLDPRGLGALGAFFANAVAITILMHPCRDAIERQAQTTSTFILGAVAFGFVMLEKHLWNRAKAIEKALQKDYEAAVTCKNILITFI